MFSDRIDETTAHELDVIDAIVRGGGEARPEDAALTDFALLVRNARPAPNHGEIAALDARAQEARASRKPRKQLIFSPVFAGACVVLLMVGVSGVAYFGSSDKNAESSKPAPTMLDSTESAAPQQNSGKTLSQSKADFAQELAPPQSSTQASTIAPEPPIVRAPGGITSAKVPREVARDTRLTLAADGAEIERLADRVNAIVDQYGGYVASSQVRGGEGNRGRATFSLMIPTTQYKPALAAISKLAHVRSRSQASQDITTEVNSAEREVKRWTSRINRLEAQYAAATTPQKRASIALQLSSAKSARREATRQVRVNRARVNYVPIALTIVADKTAAAKDKSTIVKAFDKAGKILTGIAAVLIVALAILIPIALIVAALWFGIRRWNRTRSDRTIEAAAVARPE